ERTPSRHGRRWRRAPDVRGTTMWLTEDTRDEKEAACGCEESTARATERARRRRALLPCAAAAPWKQGTRRISSGRRPSDITASGALRDAARLPRVVVETQHRACRFTPCR